MTTVLDRFLHSNPLLAHGVRTHSTGIVLATEPATPTHRVRRDVDAPRVHLGQAGR